MAEGLPFHTHDSTHVQLMALTAWLDHAGIQSGPLFRMVNKSGDIGTRALSAQSVAAIVKDHARKAGLAAEASPRGAATIPTIVAHTLAKVA